MVLTGQALACFGQIPQAVPEPFEAYVQIKGLTEDIEPPPGAPRPPASSTVSFAILQAWCQDIEDLRHQILREHTQHALQQGRAQRAINEFRAMLQETEARNGARFALARQLAAFEQRARGVEEGVEAVRLILAMALAAWMPLQGPLSEWERDMLRMYEAVLSVWREGRFAELLRGLVVVQLE